MAQPSLSNNGNAGQILPNLRWPILIAVILVLCPVLAGWRHASDEIESGTLSIYFMDEKVGYEEYTWKTEAGGFVLTVEGRITKPIRMNIEELTIRLDSAFIPMAFRFKGSVGGVAQDITSSIHEGQVENIIHVGGRDQEMTAEIKRDAFLLPNPIFAPYMAITKKYRCLLQEKVELSAYIIPQMETPFVLSPVPEASCHLIMQLSATQIELETDTQGRLNSLNIPLQKLRIIRDQ